MCVNESGRNEQSLQRTFHRCFLPSFGSFGQAVSEEEIFRNRPIRNKICLWRPRLSMDRDEMSTLYRGPPMDASFQKFQFIWLSGFREEELKKNQPIRNKSRLWRPYLSTDRDEMSNLYRGPSIDASYQVSVHLAKWFQRRFKKNRSIRNKNCLWWPCLLMDRDEMSNLNRGHSIDASYQDSVHLADGFQRHISVIQFRYLYRDNCILNTDIYI
jgi:hypothetical protein